MSVEIPLGLLAELSHRCPLQCAYCSNPTELLGRSAELAGADWERVFREAAALGVLQVHLSGGEPTVRKDLERLVEVCAEVGLYTNLITSGVLLSRDRVEGLRDAGLDHVQLSVQASQAVMADEIGGFSGGHEKKLEVARWVHEVGLALTINAVLHRKNVGDAGAIVDLAAKLGARRVEVAHTQYMGWALVNREALLPSWEEVQEATRQVEEKREEYRGRLLIDYVVPDLYGVRPKACMGGWGRELLLVAPDGAVLPCHGASSLPMEFENVKERSLRAIWEESPEFQRFRGVDWMPEPCRSCDRREVDYGGCRCQAFALTGEMERADPVCALSPDRGVVEEILAGVGSVEDPAGAANAKLKKRT